MIVLVASGVAFVSLFGVSQVLAQNSTGNYPPFVQQLAQKLGIDQSKVQSAFDEIRQENKSQMQTKFNDVLDQAVKDGKITEAQKQLILQKRQELQNTKANFKDMTPEQRRQAIQNQKQQLDDWAKQNNIDLKYLFGSGSFGHLGGFKGRWGK